MLDSVKLFKVGQNANAVKQSQQKVSFKGSELPQSINISKDKADSFKKSLKRFCALDSTYISD
jgi:hypothetical protein